MKIEKKEKRTVNVELRTSNNPESRTIEGYAALFDSRSELMYDFYEVISPSAFLNADLADIRALFNHDPNGILARTKSNTLEVEIDETGLLYRFDAPNTTLGNDLLEMVRRGDVSQSSFAFTILPDGDEWSRDKENDMLVRTITKIDRVYDVSPVTYPAYAQTTVTARSLEAAKNTDLQNAGSGNSFDYGARKIFVLRSKTKKTTTNEN